VLDAHCNVLGSSEAIPACDIADIYAIDRFLKGGDIKIIGSDCPAFLP
jgi:hypothetical protein